LELLPKFEDNLSLYKRSIDDVLGLWLPIDPVTDATRWEEFIAQMNCPVFGLKWIVSHRSMEVDYLDLNIKIQNNKIMTYLFEKLPITIYTSHPIPHTLLASYRGWSTGWYTVSTHCAPTTRTSDARQYNFFDTYRSDATFPPPSSLYSLRPSLVQQATSRTLLCHEIIIMR
jgi:hypothetical protein